jgi:hypothetical protein
VKKLLLFLLVSVGLNAHFKYPLKLILIFLFLTKSFGFNNEGNLFLVAPTINNINPTEYCYNNPQNITISGTNLASVTTVYIGTTNIPDITVSNTTIIINSIPVGTPSGLIRVVAPDGDDQSVVIFEVSNLPNTPGSISGNSQLYIGSTEYNFSVVPVSGADAYVWTFSPNISADVVYGGNPTNERTLRFSVPNTVALGDYTLSVYAQNSCGDGSSSSLKSFNVGQLPNDAGEVTEVSNATFNYQAIVKDSDGNPVTNNQVKFKFSLMHQSSTATPVYVEEHELVTPPDDVVNLSVGGGTVLNGTFSNIDWSQNVFMKEELDTGSGYQDMGTRQIASVPVAEYAKRVAGLNTTSSTISLDSDISSFNTTGVVSATGFKGSGDEITLTDSGTITTLLELIEGLKNEIELLKQSNSSSSTSNGDANTSLIYTISDF